MIVYGNDEYDHPLIWDEYNDNQDIERPETAINIDYINDQMQYRLKQLLDAKGEHFQLYRRKISGIRCNNPVCPANNDYRKAGMENCRVCLGTGYIGGYDYIGELLISVAPADDTIIFNVGGQARITKPYSWTLANPELQPNDILFSLDRERYVQSNQRIDFQTYLDITVNPDFSQLLDENGNLETSVSRILKISDQTNQTASYSESVDYVLSNNGVLWVSDNRPDPFTPYFVTYERTTTFIQMHEVTRVMPNYSFRGVKTTQKLEFVFLDYSHHLYGLLSVESGWDQSRFLYPFPVDEWYERDQ